MPRTRPSKQGARGCFEPRLLGRGVYLTEPLAPTMRQLSLLRSEVAETPTALILSTKAEPGAEVALVLSAKAEPGAEVAPSSFAWA